MRTLFAPLALLPDGWARDVEIDIDGHGNIAATKTGAVAGRTENAGGPVVPGMSNLHSHAFQRAMAGRTERRGADAGDDFWSWRELMYHFMVKLAPEHVRAIAAQLYVELLKGGYTAVGEFHYLHNDPLGRPYADPAEMAFAHVRAAREAGIALTLMPSLYGFGGVGGEPLGPAQRRFATTPKEVGRILESLQRHVATEREVRLGIAPHSLRAVTAPTLGEMITIVDDLDRTAPIHIHVAEQQREVDACVATLGARPLEWLLDRFHLGPRWCLVHCTQSGADELQRLAITGAHLGICPTTEADLGDGLLDFGAYQEAGGSWGIGSDSHVGRSAADELRLLEYGQRLGRKRRHVAATESVPSVGTHLWKSALAGGAAAIGRKSGAIAPGYRADLVVLDPAESELAGLAPDELLDAFVFGCSQRVVRHVAVSGRWVIRDRHHRMEGKVADRYRRAVEHLTA